MSGAQNGRNANQGVGNQFCNLITRLLQICFPFGGFFLKVRTYCMDRKIPFINQDLYFHDS